MVQASVQVSAQVSAQVSVRVSVRVSVQVSVQVSVRVSEQVWAREQESGLGPVQERGPGREQELELVPAPGRATDQSRCLYREAAARWRLRPCLLPRRGGSRLRPSAPSAHRRSAPLPRTNEPRAP